MFNDYPHRNEISKDNPNYIIKFLDDKIILKKEFYVLDFLSKYSFTPKVYNFDGKCFFEEKLIGKSITKKDLTNENIKKIALSLKKLHTIDLPINIEKLISNKFLVDYRYQPALIARVIIKEVPIRIISKYGEMLYNIAKDFEFDLRDKKYKICLVHGDLSWSNIFLQNKNIFMIDWTECRLDISSCDVAQLFRSLNFNQKQEKLFLKYYGMGYIDDRVLIFHKILLLLYDLASSAILRQAINKKRTIELSLLCKSFYDF